MEAVFLILGGAMGSLTRFKLGSIISKKADKGFPLATFIINISGAILLGVVNGLHISGNLLLFLADGFLGSYTTFSTFMYEGITLFNANKKINAYFYVIITLLLGIAGFEAGFSVTEWLIK